MRYWVYVMVCLCVVVAQSVGAPAPLPLHGLYDLMVPVLVYLAVFRPAGEAITVALAAGLMMDAVSGGAFGLYLLTYLWMTGGIRIAMGFFHGEGVVFIVSAVLAGVLLENAFFLGAGRVAGVSYAFGATAAGGLAWQLVVAGLTGPFLVFGFNGLFRRLAARFEQG